MRTQIWIIASAFFIFGIIAWVGTQTYSPAYIGLMLFGLVSFAIGLFGAK
jgi:hypothetical protein